MLFHYWKHLYVRKLMPLTKRLVFLSLVFSTLLGFPNIDAVAADPILSDRVDAVSGDPTASSSGTKVRLGLLDFEFESSYLSRVEDIQATVLKHLQASTPGIVIEPRYYKTKDLAEAVRKGEVEFFLGSSGFFVEMRPYGVRDIGTIVSSSFPDPNQCVADVIFVRNSRTDLQTIADLEHRTASATDPRNFMTYQIGMGEIAKAGYDPDSFFRRTIFTDSKPQKVVENVLSGKADVGFLRACMLEAMERRNPQWQGKLRVINERTGPRAERLGCRYSTDMYPGWTFAVTSHTPPILTRHVATALLSLDPKSTPSGFEVSFATDYARVNDLLKTLRIGPYAYLREWTLRGFLKVSWPFLMLAAALAFAWILHWLRLETLVRQRTAELEKAWDRERIAEVQARKAADKLDRMHCVSVVGELSSIFAHELGQPLSVMRYLTRSLGVLMKKPDPDRKLVEECVGGLQKQITHAAEILERVRKYAKQGAKRGQNIDLTAVVRDALSELEESRRLTHAAVLDASDPVMIQGDPVELRILVRNLLKNADEALCAMPDDERELLLLRLSRLGIAPIRITVKRIAAQERAELSVENSGSVLSSEALSRLTESGRSEKENGLGLGLLICRSIVERHLANLSFEAIAAEAGGGLKVCVSFAVVDMTHQIHHHSENQKNDAVAP